MWRRLMRTSGSWGPTILRLGFGFMLMAHGSQTMFGAFGGGGLGSFASFLQSQHVPLPLLAAVLAAAAEFCGGLALVVGFLVRLAAVPILVTMLVGIRLVHWEHGFFIQENGFEYAAMVGVVMVSLMISGGGAMSLDERLSGRRGA